MRKNFPTSIICLILSIIFPFQVKAETVLEKIQKTGLIKVAVREDAVPFSYRDLNGNLTGLCLDFIYLLEKRIKKELNRDILFIRLVKSTLFNRFEIVENNIVYLECGPNTIRSDLKFNVAFSDPFFITGTQFLIKKENEKTVNPDGSLENIIIGVLRDTTTEEFVESKYPLANIEIFKGVTGRLRGIQALQQGKLDAFASDGILLVGEGVLQGLTVERYKLVPEQPLTCEYYGIIVPKNDPQWRNLVNSVIQSTPLEEILKEWFNVVFPYIGIAKNFCEGDN